MSDEEAKLETASGGGDPETLSEEDKKILAAFKGLHFMAPIETTEDLVSFMKKYGTVTGGKGAIPKDPVVKAEPGLKSPDVKEPEDPSIDPGHGTSRPITSYHFPKLSQFHGEGSKGEVSWETFKFEIEALRRERLFSEEQILQGIRRAVKGEAGDIIRRLGPEARIRHIVDKLDSTYGNIETKESILRKFYSCTQQHGQTVTAYASQLEEIFSQAVTLGAMRRSDTEILKQVLHQGLNRDLKHMSTYKCETVADYDRFKIELRKLEAGMKEESGVSKEKTCKPVVRVDKQDGGGNAEVMELLNKINDRIDRLEKKDAEKMDAQGQQQFRPRSWHTESYRGMPRIQPRGAYRPVRPTGGTTFQPTCFGCGQKGHIIRDCPKGVRPNQPTCFGCQQKGHILRNCPKG